MVTTHKYLSNLTPLRGFAAIWVVVFHFQATIMNFNAINHTHLVAKGYMMVDLFFIMSGFIISHVYQQSFQPVLSSKNFRRFIVARFARVYPLHFFTLLILVLLIAPGGNWNPVDDPKAIPTNLLLIHSFGIHKVFTWNVPSWSISAEWWAYMVFPLLVIFIYRKKKLAFGLLGIFAITAYLAIMYWLPRHDPFIPEKVVPHNLDSTFDYGFLRGLAGFICGMLLYKLYEAGLFRKIFQKDITAVLVIGFTVFCLHLGINDGLYIILFIVVVYTFALNEGKLHSFCNNRIVQYLGLISYSIYLSQLFAMILVWAIGKRLPGVTYLSDNTATTGFWRGSGYCLIFMILVIGFSSLTYFTIEKPLRKYINRKWGKEKMPVYA
jgi:peptidoglycan/LPS O-acetylase OafA/YrhL